MALPAVTRRQAAPPTHRRADVHRVRTRTRRRAMQGRHRRRISGAERTAPGEALVDWIRQIKARLAAAYAEEHPDQPVAPFAVNQIVHPSNPRLLEDMQVCVEEQVPIIITSLSPPARSYRPCTPTVAWSSTTSSTCGTRARPYRRELTALLPSVPARVVTPGP